MFLEVLVFLEDLVLLKALELLKPLVFLENLSSEKAIPQLAVSNKSGNDVELPPMEAMFSLRRVRNLPS